MKPARKPDPRPESIVADRLVTLQPRVPARPQAALQLVPRLALSLVGARRASLLLKHESGEVWLEAAEGGEFPMDHPLDIASGVAGEVLRSKQPLMVNDLGETRFDLHPERGYATRSCMVVPILEGRTLYGAICVADPVEKPLFTDDDLTRLTLLAQHAGHSLRIATSLHIAANVDALTGVGTHSVFDERLAAEVERSRRFGRPVSIMVLDVDHLQRLNEQEGHLTGDHLLRWVARVVTKRVRRVDTVARYGGDEFAVVLPETGAEESFAVASRIVDGIHSVPVVGRGQPGLGVRVSVGMATLPPASSATELLARAFQAMHVAKRNRAGIRHWDLGNGVP